LSALAASLRRFEPSWVRVGRVHRRLCFLRSEGREAEAREVEGSELAAAVAEARRVSGSDAEADALLSELFTEGEERVADAVAFAEVLLPMLAQEMRPAAPALAHPAQGHRQRKPSALRPGGDLEIADFIDEMLAQDKTGNR
jgi:hypothetical protein